jgi:predicted transcriptional regulator of viral defense system
MNGSQMQKGNYLTALLRSKKTVFTIKDIALLWHEPVTDKTRVRVNYYINQGDLYRIRRGIYAKDQYYDRLELATRIFAPSYVSFETVLVKEGLVFQFYEKIFVAAYLSREITIDQQTYTFRKIRSDVLTYPIGVEHVNETSIATAERALLDTLYLNLDYQFDNLRSIEWEKIRELLPIYRNQRMASTVDRLYHSLAET